LKFINRYRDTWPPAIACISGGILDLERLVTHKVSLEKSSDALHIASDTKNGSIKVFVVDDENVTL
jgi:L-iditol 2-dehydrogenase